MKRALARGSVVVAVLLLAPACQEATSPVDLGAVEVSGVEHKISCGDVASAEGCAAALSMNIGNSTDQPVTVEACLVEFEDPAGEHGFAVRLQGGPQTVGGGQVISATLSFKISPSFERTPDDIEAIAGFNVTCPAPPGDEGGSRPFAAGLACSDAFATTGPVAMAEAEGLDAFEPAAVAQGLGGGFGWDEAEIGACQRALATSLDRYERAERDGWKPWGTELRWRSRWSAYYLCAVAVFNDYPGAPRRALQGQITPEEAAPEILDRTSHVLDEPAIDGCMAGIRFGIESRTGG